MGARKIYDLAVVVGSYEKNGETKHRYQNIGAMMQEDDGGKFLLMERNFNPAGVPHDPSKGNSILVSMFEPRADGQSGGSPRAEAPANKPQAQSGAGDDFTDDIPF